MVAHRTRTPGSASSGIDFAGRDMEFRVGEGAGTLRRWAIARTTVRT